MTRLNAANNAQALLVGDITAAATSFYVDDASVFPAAPFLISIDDEIMKVGTVLGNLLSDIDRAQEGTTAAAHASDSLVENRWTAGMYNALATQEEVDEHKADYAKHNNNGQLTFPATQNPSSDPNILDDYEEGTWTPADGSGAGLSLAVTFATYTKIGRQVTIITNITYPTTADINYASLSGVPFATVSSQPSVSMALSDLPNGAIAQISDSRIYLYPYNSSIAYKNSALSGKTFWITLTYNV